MVFNGACGCLLVFGGGPVTDLLLHAPSHPSSHALIVSVTFPCGDKYSLRTNWSSVADLVPACLKSLRLRSIWKGAHCSAI